MSVEQQGVKLGNPRKPTELKIVHGTQRKDRTNPNEPKPPISVPDPPKHLSKEAGEEWRRIVPLLEEQKLITELDRAALAMYCQAWGDHVKAENMIRKQGAVITTKSGNLIQSPWVGISNRSKEIARKLLAQFGMTPADRSKVSAQIPTDKPTGKERFFK